MTQEQFKRAMEIQKEILDISTNKENTEIIKRRGNIALSLGSLSGGRYNMLDNVLPIPAETFIDMYLISADKKIIELEKEFEKL